jgi:4-amino-4-deoxy-L-arabinose transferase-like glycosyltransferase
MPAPEGRSGSGPTWAEWNCCVSIVEPRRRGALRAGLLVAAAFLLLELALCHRALVEPDSVHMSYGIAHAIRSGEGLAARDLYGRSISFGYYLLFIWLYPHLGVALSALPITMNVLNMFCVAAAFVPLVWWMSRLWGRGVALAAAGLLATTPVLFELGGAGHPSGPAFLFVNVALALFLAASAPGARRRLVLLAGATAAAFLAASFRGTAIFSFVLFPFLGLLPWRAPRQSTEPARDRSVVLAGLGVGLVATLGFLVAQRIVKDMAPAGQRGILTQLLAHVTAPLGVRGTMKGLAVWATGVGPLLLSLGWIGIVGAFRRRDRALGWAALALLVPSLVLWFPNPTPSRHFHLTYLVLVPAAVLWLRSRFERRFARAAILLLVLNLGSMAAVYPIIVRHYRFTFVKVLPRRTSTRVPLGDPVTNRIWLRRRVALEEAAAGQLAAASEPRLLVLGSPVSLRLVFHIVSGSSTYRLDYPTRHGAAMIDANTRETSYAIYDYAGSDVTPAELMQRIAAAGEFRDYAVAVIPVDLPVDGAAEPPPGYQRHEFASLPALW